MSILLTNLDISTTSADIKGFLSQLGVSFRSVEIIFDKLSGKSTGRAIIGFDSDEDANKLLKNIYIIQGKQVEAQILKTI